MQAKSGYLLLAITLMATAAPARAQSAGGPAGFGGGGFGGGFPGSGFVGGGFVGGVGGGLAVRADGPPILIDPDLYARLNQYQADLSIQNQLYRDKVKALDSLRGQFAASQPQVKQAQESLDRTRIELAKLQAGISDVQKAIQERYQKERARIDVMLAPYQRPVSVDLRDATVRQAAEALSKVAGMEISVDESVPETTRLKVQAKGVALGAILEAIAEPAGLELAPSPKGIKITSWPTLKVNEDVTVFTGQFAPWADEMVQRWGFRPSFGGGQRAFLARPGFGVELPGLPGGAPGAALVAPLGGGIGGPAPEPGPQPSAPLPPPEATPPVAPASGAASPAAASRCEEPLALLALGNQSVVSLEPVPDDPQRAKVLRLYRFHSGGPRVVSVTSFAVARVDQFPAEIALPRAGGFEAPTWSLQTAGPDKFAVVERHPRVRGTAVLLRAEFRLQGDRLIPMGITSAPLPTPKPPKATPAGVANTR